MAADNGDVIKLDEFLDPALSPYIKEVTDGFRTLDSVFTATQQSIQKQTAVTTAELRKQAEANLKYIQSLTTGDEAQQLALQNLSKETTKLITEQQRQASQQKQLSDGLSQTTRNIDELKGKLSELVTTIKSLNITDAEATNALKVLRVQTQALKNDQLSLTNALLEQKKASDAIIQANKQEEAASKAATAAIREKNAAARSTSATSVTMVDGGDNLAALNSEAASTAAATGTVVSDLEKQEQEATLVAIEWAAAQREAGTTAAAITPEIEAEITAIQQLSQALVSSSTELTAVNLEIKELDAAYKSGLITYERYITETASLKVQQQQLSTAIGATRKELAQQVAVADGNVGAYELLNREYLAAKKNAYDLAAAEGVQSKAAIEAAATAKELNTTLKAIDESVGNSQRNVGNYASGFSKAFGLIRQAAYILPGIGVAGIFNLLFEGLSAVTAELLKTTPAFNAARESIRNYVGVQAEAQKGAEQEIINLRIQQKVIGDVNLPMSVRIEAIKTIKDEYPGYLKNISDEAFLSGQAAAQIDVLSKALFQKAFAEAAANKAAALGVENLDLRGRETFLLQEQAKELKNINFIQTNIAGVNKASGGGLLPGGSGVAGANVELVKAQSHLNDINELLQKNGEKQKFNNDQINYYIDAAAKASPVIQNLTKGDGGLAAQTDTFKSYLAQLLKAQEEGRNLELNEEIKFRQAVADSDSFGAQERLTQQRAASALRIQQITESRDAELAANQAQEDEALRQYNNAEAKANANTKLKADERGKILGQAAAERNIAEAAYQQERANIVAKADIALQNEAITNSVALANITKREHDRQIAEAAKFAKELQDAQAGQFNQVQSSTQQAQIDFNRQRFQIYLTDLKTLNEKYRSGEITDIKDFDRRRKQIEDDYNHDILSNQVEFGQATIDNLKTVPNLTKEQNDILLKLQDDLNKGRKDLYEQDAKNFDDAQKSKEAAQKRTDEILQASFDLANTFVTGLNELYQASSEQRISQLEKQKDDEIAIAGDNKAAQDAINKKYAKLEAEQKRKAAIADKIAALFQIGVNTAVAVSHALIDQQFLIPFIIATGAIEAAIVAAKPIPTYYTGRRQGGPAEGAILGEQGTEAIEHAHGGVTLTRSGAHFRMLSAGDKVYQTGSAETNYYKKVAENIQYDNITNNIVTGKQASDVATMTRAMAAQPFAGLTYNQLVKGLETQPKEVYIPTERGILKFEEQQRKRIQSMNKRQGFGDENS